MQRIYSNNLQEELDINDGDVQDFQSFAIRRNSNINYLAS
jgi:hypothetical protein